MFDEFSIFDYAFNILFIQLISIFVFIFYFLWFLSDLVNDFVLLILKLLNSFLLFFESIFQQKKSDIVFSIAQLAFIFE